MNAAAILGELRAAGVHVEARGDRLKVRGPKRALTAGVVERLKRHKAELLAALCSPAKPSTAVPSLRPMFVVRLNDQPDGFRLLGPTGYTLEDAWASCVRRFGADRVRDVRAYRPELAAKREATA